MDTILGLRVALKIPHADYVTDEVLKDFRREARTTFRLDHKNILPIRDASFINEHFVIVFPLGERTLDERMSRRMAFKTAHDIATQLIAGTAYAHAQSIIHCDIKPENIILFEGNRVRLADFGIAKVAQRTIRGSGTGTVGHMAPEQAMGKPSSRSDVFSIGLVLYRLFAGEWPEWPFEWPAPGYARLKRKAHPDLIALIRRSIDPQPKKRFRDAGHMLNTWEKCRTKVLRYADKRR